VVRIKASVSHGESLTFFFDLSSCLWLRCDGNLNVSAFFKTHIIAVFVGKGIFDTEISISVVGPVNGNLRLFRLARTWRWDDFVDGPRHRDAWLFWNSRRV